MVEPDGLVAEHFVDLFAQLAHRLGVFQEEIEDERQHACTLYVSFRFFATSGRNTPEVVSWPAQLTVSEAHKEECKGRTSDEEGQQLYEEGHALSLAGEGGECNGHIHCS